MINRRLIRIKVFQALFGELGQEKSNHTALKKQVLKSINGIHSNFLGVLSFGPQLSHYISSEHNPEEYKFKPSEEDIKSFKHFTQNPFILDLEANATMKEYMARPTLDWQQEKETMFLIFKEFKKTDIYRIALLKPLNDETYFEIAKYLYKYIILESVEFEQLMEDKNIYWYDEKIPVLKASEKVLAVYEENTEVSIEQDWDNKDEDEKMAEDLMDAFFAHHTEMQEVVNEFTPGWDSDRITKIDYVLMILALCEFKYMPMIPVKVTLNEYIEIAKMYSTPKSSKFLNGTLDKILHDWKAQNQIQKVGRGLIG
jgi:N utilization substance protein B